MNKFIDAISLLTDKNGTPVLPVLEDMKQREGGVLIVNLACDDSDAQINAYIAERYCDVTAAGIVSLADAGLCDEIIIYGCDNAAEKLTAAVKAQTAIPVTVLSGPASPVLRDETALFSVMDTGIIRVNRAEHDYSKSFPSFGYHGRPTLVIDGETAYQAGRIYHNPDTAVTKHIAVIGGETVIYELKCGTAFAELPGGNDFNGIALAGGTRGSLMDGGTLRDTRAAFIYEHDSIRIFDDKDCVVNELDELYKSIKELSCAKCVLCREGSRQLSAIFSDITAGRANRDDAALIEDICPIIQAGALCSFGKGMVKPAITAVSVYRGELEKHISMRSCSAGKCKGLMNYIIDPSMCTGCGDCMDECPEEAIDGKAGFIHIIDKNLCEKCGKCVDICADGAIKLNGGNIKVPKRPVRAGTFR